MNKPKTYLALTALVLLVLAVNAPILKFPLSMWHEPFQVIAHIVIAVILFMVLAFRISLMAAFFGALLFAVYPGHAAGWAAGGKNWLGIVGYLLVLIMAAMAAIGCHRFYIFLRTQEVLVRYIFLVASGLLVAGMLLLTVQINAAWGNEASIWQWRATHHPSARALNAWAGLSYLKFGDAERSIVLYEQSLKIDPSNKAARFALAGIYQDLGNREEVIGVYNELLKAHPEDDQVYAGVIQGYGRAFTKYPNESIYQEKREEALAAYEQVSKRKNYTANDYFNLGFLYEQVGGYEEAMRFYRKALGLSPNHEKSLYNLAHRYQAAGDLKTALALYERLVHFHSKNIGAYLNMGVIYNALGDADKARYLYQKVVAIDPNDSDAYFNLGYLSEVAGEIREALGFYEKAVENDPKNAEAYYNMGNMYASLKQYPEAIASYLKTVAINRKHQNAYVNLSIMSFKAKDFQGAIRYLEEAKLLGYTPPEAYLKTLEPYKKK